MFGTLFTVCILSTNVVKIIEGGKLLDEAAHDLVGNTGFPVYRRQFKLKPLPFDLHQESVVILPAPDVEQPLTSREYYSFRGFEPNQLLGRAVTNSRKTYTLLNDPRRIKNPLRESTVNKERANYKLKGLINRYSSQHPLGPPHEEQQELKQRNSNEKGDELTSVTRPTIRPYAMTLPTIRPDDIFVAKETIPQVIRVQKLCVEGFIFNGNGECVCPAGYRLTRSKKCHKPKKGKFPKL